jgi:hypothetical protein
MTLLEEIRKRLAAFHGLTPTHDKYLLRRSAAEVERLTQENADLLKQLRQQTKSFCTHCGKLFPQGKVGMEQFRAHIAECNSHPLHPLAKEVERLRGELERLRDVVCEEDCESIQRVLDEDSKGPTP